MLVRVSLSALLLSAAAHVSAGPATQALRFEVENWTTPKDAWAKGFAAGLMPGLVWEWIMGIKPEKRRQEALTMLGNCCRLYREEGLDFLLYGRMLKPLKIDVPQRVLTLGKHPDLIVPAVTHSVWRAPDGRVAATFFSPERKPHTVALPDGRSVTVPALGAAMALLDRPEERRK